MSWLDLWRAAPVAFSKAPTAAPTPTPTDPTWASFEALLRLREGCRLVVYLDSLGKPTVGIGHLVLPADHLSVGQTITQAEVDALFLTDGRAAFRAAQEQMALAKITDEAFLPYLASVCFQLGDAWNREFAGTWGLIMARNYKAAAAAVGASAWAKQTPTRVQDFQEALNRLT